MYLTDDLRVNDFDASQYTIEKAIHSEKTGKTRWEVYAYVEDVTRLPTIVQRYIDEQLTGEEKIKMNELFTSQDIARKLLQLPKKTGNSK